jgi:hypothetical protein
LFFGHGLLLLANVRARAALCLLPEWSKNFDTNGKRKEGLPLRAALPLSGLGPVAQAIICLTRVSPAVDQTT